MLDGQLALVSPGNTLTDLTRGTNTNQPVRTDDNYFRVVGADSLQAQFLAQQAKNLGFTKAAVVSETKAVSQGLADQFAAAFKSGGGTVVVQHTVVDGNTNFTDFINSAKPLNPDLIFFGGEYKVAATLRTQATAAGLTAPQMGGDGMLDDEYISGAGPSAAGSYASTVGQPLNKIPGATRFLAAYDYGSVYSAFGYAENGHIGRTDGGDAEVTLNGYTATLCQSIKANKDDDATDEDIVIYSIGFDIAAGSTIDTAMRNCASAPSKYFNAPSTDQLQGAFESIALGLTKLRLAR